MYPDDRQAILSEKVLRHKDHHIKPHWGGPYMENEYLEFLDACQRHANSVGDRKIAIKLWNRELAWKEELIKNWDWSAVWSRKKPKKKN